MTLRLSEYPVNSEHVVKNLIEQDQGNVQLFLVENFQSGIENFYFDLESYVPALWQRSAIQSLFLVGSVVLGCTCYI